MDSGALAPIVFASVFGSALFGFYLGKKLPDRHLDGDSKDIVKLATGLIATLSALVLGLLVSSAKGTFDQAKNELMQMAVKIVVLDRVLAQYGPEAAEIRELLKTGFTEGSRPLISGNKAEQDKLDSSEGVARLEGVQLRIRELTPRNDAQRGLQLRATQITSELATSRWLLIMQRRGSISIPLLVVMVLWLSIIFAAWGVYSPRNLIVAVTLCLSALAVSGATFLILELDQPLTGVIRVSPGPLQRALEHLGE
ncbi:MAG TPA: hypothetical protein VLB68_05720 [Pyrinomonadaceae bacterium]|nr:hypothetical protein [Pyrinomonadaceae bacterium]